MENPGTPVLIILKVLVEFNNIVCNITKEDKVKASSSFVIYYINPFSRL
jgi:hypothetical protein